MKRFFRKSILFLLSISFVLQAFSGVFLFPQSVDTALAATGVNVGSPYIDLGSLSKFCPTPSEDKESHGLGGSRITWKIDCDWGSAITSSMKQADYVMFVAAYTGEKPDIAFSDIATPSHGDCKKTAAATELSGIPDSWNIQNEYYCTPVVRSSGKTVVSKATFNIGLITIGGWDIDIFREEFHLRAYINPPNGSTYPELIALVKAPQGEWASYKTIQSYYFDFKNKLAAAEDTIISESDSDSFLALADKFDKERKRWSTDGTYCQGELGNNNYLGGNLCTRPLFDINRYNIVIVSGLDAINASRLGGVKVSDTEAYGNYEDVSKETDDALGATRDNTAISEDVNDSETGKCGASASAGLTDLFGGGGVFTNLACSLLYMIVFVKGVILGWVDAGRLFNVLVVSPEDININESVITTWTTIRTIANVIFILGFLVMALLNVLRVDLKTWQFQRMIPQIVFAIILVNLSLAINSFVLLVANQLTQFFLSGVGEGGIATLLGGGPGGAVGTFSELKGASVGEAFLKTIAGIVFALIVLYLYIVLWVRVILLNILFAFSAIPYIARALPIKQLQEATSKVWGMFISWTFMAPIASLFLYMAGVVGSSIGGSEKLQLGLGDATQSSAIITTAIVGVLMYLAATEPLKLGGAIMKRTQDLLSGKENIPGTKINPIRSAKQKAGEVAGGVKAKLAASGYKAARMSDADIEKNLKDSKLATLGGAYLKARSRFYKGVYAGKRAVGYPGEYKKSAEKSLANEQKEYNKKRAKAEWERKLEQPFWEDKVTEEKEKNKSTDANSVFEALQNEYFESDGSAKDYDKLNKAKIAGLMMKLKDMQDGVYGSEVKKQAEPLMKKLQALTGGKFDGTKKEEDIMKGDYEAIRNAQAGLANSRDLSRLENLDNISMQDISSGRSYTRNKKDRDSISRVIEDVKNKEIASAKAILQSFGTAFDQLDDKIQKELTKALTLGDDAGIQKALKGAGISDANIGSFMSQNGARGDRSLNVARYRKATALQGKYKESLEATQAQLIESSMNLGIDENNVVDDYRTKSQALKDAIKNKNKAEIHRLAKGLYGDYALMGEKDIGDDQIAELQDRAEAMDEVLILRDRAKNGPSKNNADKTRYERLANMHRPQGSQRYTIQTNRGANQNQPVQPTRQQGVSRQGASTVPQPTAPTPIRQTGSQRVAGTDISGWQQNPGGRIILPPS